MANAEANQSAVIATLIESGDEHVAGRLTRCQRERRCRSNRCPWRCQSAGCWQCRRAIMRRWWRGFRIWHGDAAVSLAVIPLSGELISATRRLRKGVRDVRDRTARHDRRWARVAMAGLVDGDRALILIDHPGITRAEVWSVFERRWPEIGLQDAGDIEPSSPMIVEDAVALARRRRGVEPIRIVVLAQMAMSPGSTSENDQPMPCWSNGWL
jgi:hypothetical protein